MGVLEIVDSKRDIYRTEINFEHYDISLILEETERMGFNFVFCSSPSDGERQKHMVIMSRVFDDESFNMRKMRNIVSETFIRAFNGF